MWVKAPSGRRIGHLERPGVEATSAPFDVTPAAAHQIAFATQPGDAVAIVAFAPAPRVEVRDRYGNVATQATATIRVVLGEKPGGAVLGGTASVETVEGIATFDDLTIDKAGRAGRVTARRERAADDRAAASLRRLP